MWCYRCGAAFSYSSQVTCWFSTAQRHHTIRACTIQRWVRCMQGLFMYMDTMYNTIYVDTDTDIRRHIYENVIKMRVFFFYCLCYLRIICRENGYLMEIYTLYFLKSNSQSPFTIMYWIWQIEQWQYFTYCAQSAYVLYCTYTHTERPLSTEQSRIFIRLHSFQPPLCVTWQPEQEKQFVAWIFNYIFLIQTISAINKSECIRCHRMIYIIEMFMYKV